MCPMAQDADNMASEMIDRVQQAEKLSEQAMAQAQTRAQQILSDAKSRISALDATSRNQTDIKATRILDTAGGISRENAIKSEKAALEKGEKLKNEAKNRQAAVNKAVLSEILA